MKMTRINLKGIHKVTKKLASGEVRIYHYAWRGGPKFWANNSGIKIGSPEYITALGAASPKGQQANGLFRSVILKFLDSAEFIAKAPRYQKDILTSINHPKNGIDAEFGDAPLGAMNDRRIRGRALAWRDRIGGKVGDDRISHLRLIVAWAVDRAILYEHRLTGIKSVYRSNRAHIMWTEVEVDLFVAGAPIHVGRILIAALETGLRPQDICVLSRFHIQKSDSGARRIVIPTQKRGRVASIPVTARMAELIDSTPKAQSLFIVNKGGQQYKNPNYLGDAVTSWRDTLKIRKELRLYDARGTAATRLLDAGAEIREIAVHMGWSIKHATEVIETYVSLHPDMADNLGRKIATLNANKQLKIGTKV